MSAVHARKKSGVFMDVSEDSSCSDEEVLKRCREAVWETQANHTKDTDSDVKQSKRVVVADHEHDGNELQVTQGFQKHVAKKLGHFLDSYISESQTEPSYCPDLGKCDDVEGFRLFSTSIPGQAANKPPSPVQRRRPVPSSSDSDSEMETRLKEAAVSIKDLLPSLPSTGSTPSAELVCSEKKKKKKKVEQGEESSVVKKKKKRNEEDSVQPDSAGFPFNALSNGEQKNSEQEHKKVKRKKKKSREQNTEEHILN